MPPIEPQIVLTAFLVLLRTGSIIFALPLFGDSSVPLKVRLMFSIAISICIFPIVSTFWAPAFPDDLLVLGWLVLREILLGVTIGYVAKFLFDGVIMAASLVGYQMGFGTANLLVPDADAQMSSFTAFHRIIIILIFLGLDLHHIFLRAIIETFTLIPAGAAIPNSSLMELIVTGTAAIFATAIQLSSPILVALLFSMATLGLIARTVPQMNVFTMSFPLSFFLGLLIYVATSPFLIDWLKEHYTVGSQYIFAAIQGLTPV